MMKIVAGLGSVEEYIPYVEAGAAELFCGFVPEEWMLSEGLYSPLNRREVLYYNVQIGSYSELQILQHMIAQYGMPVTIAFNALSFAPHQYPKVMEIMEACMEIGFHRFIVADVALLLYLRQNMEPAKWDRLRLHLSGETAEINRYMLREMKKLGIRRVIFHRKNAIPDMETIIGQESALEYEAFALNEMCHFTGAFCNSLHCDELTHACRLPYRLISREREDKKFSEEAISPMEETENPEDGKGSPENTKAPGQEPEEIIDCTGATGCGLCALWRLQQAGVTYLKLVSRGNYIENTIQDIRQLKKALDILAESAGEKQYQEKMKEALFGEKGCSGVCYYPEVTEIIREL